MIAASGPTALWYAARSTGYVSLLMLTAILVLGILTAMRWDSRDWPRFLTQALHRNLSLLVLVFLGIHIVTSIVDPFAGIAVLNTVAPFTGSYRPVWMGLGVLSMELLVALVITSLLRQRIGFTAWRVVHWAAYACWPLALLHTLGTGSDVRSVWALLIGLGCVGAVVFAIVWRLTANPTRVRTRGASDLPARHCGGDGRAARLRRRRSAAQRLGKGCGDAGPPARGGERRQPRRPRPRRPGRSPLCRSVSPTS